MTRLDFESEAAMASTDRSTVKAAAFEGASDEVRVMMDDDSYSTENLSSREEKQKVAIGTSETKKVGYLRAILVLVLLGVAGSVSYVVYRLGEEGEQTEFENYARDACDKVASNFQASAARRVSVIASLAKSISANAAAQGITWPYVNVPDFEEMMSLTLDLADVMSITLLPVVTRENLDKWNAFSAQNVGWYQESLHFQKESGINHSDWSEGVEQLEAVMGPLPVNNIIHPGIYRNRDNATYYETTNDDGPFLPWWQFAPAFPVPGLINYDTATNPSRSYQLRAALENQAPLVSEAWDYSDEENLEIIGKKFVLNLYLKSWQDGGRSYQDGPVSDLYYPVFDDASKSKGVAAVLTAYIYWQVYFDDVLPSFSEPVVAVLENVCGDQRAQGNQDVDHERHRHQQQYTYEIRGDKSVYVGPGDLHDPRFDYLEESTGWNAFLAGQGSEEDLVKGQCLYQVRVYPTREMEDNMSTQEPVYIMLVVLASFVITSLIFFVYDYYVERRQQLVLTKAIKSTEVVQELFPDNVRGRLFGEIDAEGVSSAGNEMATSHRIADRTTSNRRSSLSSSIVQDHVGRAKRGIVADLYQNCTVLFADIAGFTQWSSNREPAHVFQLLEDLYGAFDRIARHRKVFKVETIGDCYLAITGVPRPQKDHAVLMVMFASDCIEKMDQLVHSHLSESLGQETAQLKLRIGIHSGSVTAGVLRGERARFQLFGDTVNTASRMESNSLPGRIHVSAETAELLRAANKGTWVTPREGGIEAKGKGRLETFWAVPKRSRSSISSSVFSSGVSIESEVSV